MRLIFGLIIFATGTPALAFDADAAARKELRYDTAAFAASKHITCVATRAASKLRAPHLGDHIACALAGK